jgi:LysR family transcriptional regulator, glycine cleavage system transcriptional activator
MHFLYQLHQFTTKYPDIKIRVVSSISFENLAQNHIDLAIRFGTSVESSTQEGLICDYFGEDHVYPVCSAKLASEGKLNCPQDILNHWLIKLEKPGPFSWDVWFENAGIKHYKQHNKWTEVMSTDLALSAVQNGHGFTLAAESLFKQALANGNLVIPFLIKHPLSVKRYLVYNLSSPKKSRLKLFMDWIKTEMNK